MKAVSLSNLCNGRVYPPGNIPGTHSWFLLEAESTQGHSAAIRIMSMKNSSDTIGNQTRDLLACSTVPQPTAPPRALPLTVPFHFVILPLNWHSSFSVQAHTLSDFIFWFMETPCLGPLKDFFFFFFFFLSWCSDRAFVASSVHAFVCLTLNFLSALPLFVFSLLFITVSLNLTS